MRGSPSSSPPPKRDIPIELDLPALIAQQPDRSKLRDTFRLFELRDPLRRLEEALGSPEAVPAGGLSSNGAGAGAPAGAPNAKLVQASLTDLAKLPDDAEVALALRAPHAPEGALFGDDPAWRFGVDVGKRRVLAGECANPEALVTALAPRGVIAHDAKSLGLVPEPLAHDTEVAAYLLEPARRAYPFRELTEERGFHSDLEDEAAADAQLVRRWADWQRQELDARGLTELLREVELRL